MRETFEETGLLVGARQVPERLPEAGPWRDFLGHGVITATAALTYFARAITPPGRPRRYDTRFFCAEASQIAHRIEVTDGELSSLDWFTLDDMRALDLPGITRVVIEDLADRLRVGLPGPPDAPVPFYFHKGGTFERVTAFGGARTRAANGAALAIDRLSLTGITLASMSPRPQTILLTGFGPFPGVAENASALLVERLAASAQKKFPRRRIVADVLPTEWAAAPKQLEQLYARERPNLALHFGVSERAKGFVIETRARNECRYAPDARGARPPRAASPRQRTSALGVSIPAKRIVARLSALSIPAELSDDAGAYLCNAVLFHALCLAEAENRTSRGLHSHSGEHCGVWHDAGTRMGHGHCWRDRDHPRVPRTAGAERSQVNASVARVLLLGLCLLTLIATGAPMTFDRRSLLTAGLGAGASLAAATAALAGARPGETKHKILVVAEAELGA